ncbi:glycosyltransferase family 2 protein [Anaeromyxobacter paludicola]|uniref:Glycosyl transferase n=1 Tax=Anaeromyxobacter paludicola TaxID=2918171 RepID=A0ABM7X5V0_9BACT|nr:glycosyltransferase family 2 protein [Anaeromyxobacter paludicola]BDG07191.1 glycosyl transferase [Anaeromyxobacter paludicola]
MADPGAFIVVVNWNGAALLPACLEALLAQSPRPEVLVVDNGSADASAAAVARFPGVGWLPLGRNAGFAEANNVGLRRGLEAGARWLGVVNPDVVVQPGWLAALVAAGEAHPRAALLGGLLLLGDAPDRVNSTGLVLDRLGRVKDRDFGLPVAALRRPEGPVAGLTGGALLCRAEALREIGLFDPGYWAYYEDADLSLRAARRGFESRYVPGARALHGFGKSFGAGSPRQKYWLARNHLRFVAAHWPVPFVLAAAPLLAAWRAGVAAPLALARGRGRLAGAHLRGAGAGLLAAGDRLLARAGLRRGGGGAS